uniref:UDP-glycosyltransferases domain-containing protein n=1 Tax=Anopheles maculatus TaxID=74869 RepID=A0A182SX74_9DIPT
MGTHTLVLFVAIIASLCLAEAAKILAIFPVPLKQHQLVYRPLIEELANRGHDIVLVTTDPIETIDRTNGSLDRIQQIDLSFAYRLPVLEQLGRDGLDGRDMLRNIFDVMRTISAEELQHPAMKELISSAKLPEAGSRTCADAKCNRFDVVMVEWCGVTLMNAFAEHFRAPLVGIANGGAFINAHEALGNPNHPIGYPSIFMPFSEDLSLLQRISSVLFTVWYRFYYYTEEIPAQNVIAQTNFGDHISDLRHIEQNADLLLINAYQQLGNVRPVGPTTVYLGGIHQTHSTTAGAKLPEDLNLFLAQSDEPVVYVNLGSSLGGIAGRVRIEKIAKALEQLDLASVWVLDDVMDLINSTGRIYQSHNVPQEAVLGKLFFIPLVCSAFPEPLCSTFKLVTLH